MTSIYDFYPKNSAPIISHATPELAGPNGTVPFCWIACIKLEKLIEQTLDRSVEKWQIPFTSVTKSDS